MKLSTFDIFKHLQPEGSFFLSDEQLRQLHEALLTMLRDITALGEENGIVISLGGGSVLGAVRHGGFIPWDDDIDLNIERRDYNRFLRILREQRGDRYWIHTPTDTHDYGILSTRIRKKGTSLRMREDSYSDECGVTIDLFPLESTYDDPVRRRLHGLLCMGMGFLLSCRKFYRDRGQMRALVRQEPTLRNTFAVKTAVGFLVSWGSVDLWTRMTDRCYSMCRDENSKYVVFPAGRKHFFGETYPRAEFCAMQKLPFEDGLYYCTRATDMYMTRLYGDYNALPAPERQERHVFYTFDLGEN